MRHLHRAWIENIDAGPALNCIPSHTTNKRFQFSPVAFRNINYGENTRQQQVFPKYLRGWWGKLPLEIGGRLLAPFVVPPLGGMEEWN